MSLGQSLKLGQDVEETCVASDSYQGHGWDWDSENSRNQIINVEVKY